jgi:hypothetical protein
LAAHAAVVTRKPHAVTARSAATRQSSATF